MRAPRDTTVEAWALHVAGYRALTPGQRLRRALEMSQDVLDLARAGIRRRYPGWSSERVDEALSSVVARNPGSGVHMPIRPRQG